MNYVDIVEINDRELELQLQSSIDDYSNLCELSFD